MAVKVEISICGYISEYYLESHWDPVIKLIEVEANKKQPTAGLSNCLKKKIEVNCDLKTHPYYREGGLKYQI